MDKNTIIGFVLMGLVLVLFTWLGRPSEEELEMQRRYNDSIALVQAQAEPVAETQQDMESQLRVDDLSSFAPEVRDSVLQARTHQVYGEMASASQGDERLFTLENDSILFTLSTKGGVPVESELKTYNDYLGEPIRLIRPEDSAFNFTFVTQSNRVIDTRNLYFEGEQVSPTHVKMTAESVTGQQLIIHYLLRPKYMLEMVVESKGFEQVLASNAPYLDATIALPIYQNEKSRKTEQRYATLSYELSDGDVEELNSAKTDKEDIGGTVKWVALKDMFFSTIAYSPEGLQSVSVQSEVLGEQDEWLKEMKAQFTLAVDDQRTEPLQILLYAGPNDYALLKGIEKDIKHEFGAETNLAKVVKMGGWFRFITVWLIVPAFNFLERFISNYGLIILLLTLFIKLILSPFTYKSFLSQAKMRVLKPQVDAINEKYPKEDQMMEKQKATMELYRKAGVNTMGGCLPMLLQMPILIAMYQYFPTSINLRGESFLWATDLSTYDDVIQFGVDIPFIGSHISLFTLLMTVTQVFYMNVTQKMSGQQQMPGLKWMPYIMGVMLFSFLNQNAAGLSYYYLLSMLISILQTQVFRWSINEEKVLAQLEENKKKPRKKSKWMARLEEAQKQQEKLMREQQKGKR